MSQPTNSYALLQQYHYDAADRLIAVQPPGQSASRRFYAGTVLGNELGNEVQRTYLKLGGQLSGIRDQENSTAQVQLFGTEQQGSVLQVLSEGGAQHLAYTAHGEGADLSLPGFNGEPPDPLTGNYLLGNGYRAYNPTLQRFHGPDSFSPFGGGGLNSYAYCLGDPVNRADPTGHMSWQTGVGMGLGIVGMLYGGNALVFGAIAMTSGVSAASVAVLASVAAGLGAAGAGIAQAAISQSDPNSSAAATLGWIALGLGAASAVAGLAANQFSPANELKPRQASAMSGGHNPYEFGVSEGNRIFRARNAATARHLEAVRRVESVQQAGRTPFGHFTEAAGHLPAMNMLTSLLSADDLIALASTSRAMSHLVYAASSSWPVPPTPAAFFNMVQAAGAGQVQGILPGTLTRIGVTQATVRADFVIDPVMNQRGLARQFHMRLRYTR